METQKLQDWNEILEWTRTDWQEFTQNASPQEILQVEAFLSLSRRKLLEAGQDPNILPESPGAWITERMKEGELREMVGLKKQETETDFYQGEPDRSDAPGQMVKKGFEEMLGETLPEGYDWERIMGWSAEEWTRLFHHDIALTRRISLVYEINKKTLKEGRTPFFFIGYFLPRSPFSFEFAKKSLTELTEILAKIKRTREEGR